MLIKRPKNWEIPEREAISESDYYDRRKFIKGFGLAGLGLWGMASGLPALSAAGSQQPRTVRQTIPPADGLYRAVRRNPNYTVRREMTPEETAAAYNNFYEFTTAKDRVWQQAWRLQTRPWTVEITGEVHKPQTLDIDALLAQMPMEERVYRFRCVEAWSMTVPWVGFPIRTLIDLAQPKSSARYIRLVSFIDRENAPGQRNSGYRWPYYEGLSLAEAHNELALFVTGIFGHALPKQHGAPLRLILPWKYGYKNVKSIVKIEFVRKQPKTFWNDLAANEYDFWANVDPEVPHPRWSQATERIIPTGRRIPTRKYNGYEEFVGHLYRMK